MTTTMLHPDTTWTPTATDILRGLLDDALDLAADDSADDAPDRWSSRTPGGRTLLSLAAVARRAAGALGAEPGVVLDAGPGIVVQRELAAATHLLDEAARSAGGGSPQVAHLLAQAQQRYSALLGTVAATSR